MEFQGKQLDPFQVEAVQCIDNSESVVVSAPTGSGKTLIAEYAIHKLFSGNQRAIYTAPIKALSNQKYRDFRATMGDRVGIITGDVVINPHAQVLIMTTEIYRNILFQDIISLNDVRYVVFDEVHYINDIERGTIWEEAIIFSPPHVRFCFLSATIPNAQQFARWVEKLQQHRVRAIEHTQRPVPLEHFVYEHTLGLVPWERAYRFPYQDPKTFTSSVGRRGKPRRRYHTASHLDIIHNLGERLPCLFFVFSRKGCEDLAQEAAGRFDFTTDAEKQEIREITTKTLAPLRELESLDCVEKLRSILPKGIAIHHAGLLPNLKELVEILFARGLIRLLYATETFAVGINMPARSVAFYSLRKFDGRGFSFINLRQYYQMAGRAGRRGMDKIGTVVTLVDMNHFEREAMPRYNQERSEDLVSQFDLSYNSVLNLHLRYRQQELQQVLQDNFSQFQLEEHRTKIRRQLRELRQQQQKLPRNCRHGHPFTTGEKLIQLRLEKKRLQDNLQRGARHKRGRIKKQLHQLNKLLRRLPCSTCQAAKECLAQLSTHTKDQKLRDGLQEQLQTTPAILHLAEFKNKSRMLNMLGLLDSRGVTPRGQFGASINGYELLATEFMFGGLLEKLDAPACAALACACAYEPRPRVKFSKKLPRVLPVAEIKQLVRQRRKLELKFNLPVSVYFTERCGSLAYLWAQGTDFLTLTGLTSLSEGDIIQLFRRGVDFLRQIRGATKEHPELRDKLKEASNLLYRDIVVVQL